MTDTYILVDKEPVPCDSLVEWGRWFESADRFVASDYIGDVHVSTVFLGLDHNFLDDSAPLLFETMIFGGPRDQEMWRYKTYAEAEAGHNIIVAELKEGL